MTDIEQTMRKAYAGVARSVDKLLVALDAAKAAEAACNAQVRELLPRKGSEWHAVDRYRFSYTDGLQGVERACRDALADPRATLAERFGRHVDERVAAIEAERKRRPAA